MEYFRIKCFTSVVTSQQLSSTFPDLKYPPGFKTIAGALLVPLIGTGKDFIFFFQEGSVTACPLGRQSVRKDPQSAAVPYCAYGKSIEVRRQKEAALQTSQLKRILLANASHEVRTPLNAIINYLEIAFEGPLDTETCENLSRSHSASKSLIYVINDLLDLAKTEEGHNLINSRVSIFPRPCAKPPMHLKVTLQGKESISKSLNTLGFFNSSKATNLKYDRLLQTWRLMQYRIQLLAASSWNFGFLV